MRNLVPRSYFVRYSLSHGRRHRKAKYFHNYNEWVLRGESQLRLLKNYGNITRTANFLDDYILDLIGEYLEIQKEISNDIISKYGFSFRSTQQTLDKIKKSFANKQSDIQKEWSFIQSLERDQKIGELGKKFADLLREMSRTFRQSSIPFSLPSIYVDEDDVEYLWDNKIYRLLLNIDRSTYDVIAILRVRGNRKEYVAEFESDIDKIIGQIKGAIQSSI